MEAMRQALQSCRGVYHFHPSLPWYLINVLNSDVGGLDPLGHGVAADLVGDTFHGRVQARVGVVPLDSESRRQWDISCVDIGRGEV